MAKESMKARERKRAKTVAKYAEKRKALKEAGDYLLYKSCRGMPLQLECTTVVSLLVDQRDTFVSLEFQG